MTDSTATLAQEPLTRADRCDRCGAQAYVRAVLPGGGELLFCIHHARQHEDALRSSAVQIDDQSQRLNT